MTRKEYIDEVKVKLDEVSSFDEPEHFIAADGDADYEKVKPIVAYIDDCLDKAAWFCLNNLPLTLLSLDMDTEEHYVNISNDGVGVITNIDEYMRLVRLRVANNAWKRDVISFISTSSPLYSLQTRKWTRGGAARPVVAFSPEYQQLELYSFPSNARTTTAALTYIQCDRKVQQVASNISDFIVLRCAAYVAEILGDANNAQLFLQEYNAKLEPLLK